MNVATQLGLIIASIALLLGIMAAVRALARRYGWSPELQRKCIHIATGLYALTLPLTFSATWPVLVLAAVSLAVMLILRLPRFAREGLGSTLHGVERESYGELLLVLAVGFLFFRSAGTPVRSREARPSADPLQLLGISRGTERPPAPAGGRFPRTSPRARRPR